MPHDFQIESGKAITVEMPSALLIFHGNEALFPFRNARVETVEALSKLSRQDTYTEFLKLAWEWNRLLE
ncbi:hypothetical protein CEXT_350951 [Caerostris extrusa]|uniref:Uncharacterized protein n=1 Tax=Caerostris extrusa TaxID=172846 RepID=A0AAV4XUJ0_CAEEX|nr:hypothetical protein CEXT_350951 [Caerostris extrusa]